MSIQTQSFTTIVSNAVTAVQGGARALVDMTVGSILRAFVEAVASVTLWLQAVALQIAALTRFASSNGADADSWAADYGFVRLPSKAATGVVTFARFTPTAQTVIPVGAIVQTADGSQKYAVIADTTQPAFSVLLSGYLVGAGVASVTATVQSTLTAAAANAAAGFINTLGVAMPGIDTVTNAAGLINGADPETDAAFRARFIVYMASLSKATAAAIGNAVLALQQGVSYSLTENFTYGGVASQGYFYVVVDDGTGAPSATFLSTAALAIDAVRPVGSTFGVFAPTVVPANVSMAITTAAGYAHAAVAALAAAAVTSYINALPLGAPLPFTKISQVAYGASPGITNVFSVAVNTTNWDLSATAQQVIKASAVAVS